MRKEINWINAKSSAARNRSRNGARVEKSIFTDLSAAVEAAGNARDPVMIESAARWPI